MNHPDQSILNSPITADTGCCKDCRNAPGFCIPQKQCLIARLNKSDAWYRENPVPKASRPVGPQPALAALPDWGAHPHPVEPDVAQGQMINPGVAGNTIIATGAIRYVVGGAIASPAGVRPARAIPVPMPDVMVHDGVIGTRVDLGNNFPDQYAELALAAEAGQIQAQMRAIANGAISGDRITLRPTARRSRARHMLPEGVIVGPDLGTYQARCLGCERWTELLVDLHEIPRTGYEHWCGGSPHCVPF